MSVVWEQVVVATSDPVALGRWWCEALGWVVVVDDDPILFEIRAEPDRLPSLLLLRSDDPKRGHNRLHLDFRPDDHEAEVARFLAHGATRVDVGQGDVSWEVLADPDGNEFCILEALS